MVSFETIWAVVLRHIRMWRRDFNYILGGFYWPILDILIWGFLGSWIQQSQPTQFHNYKEVALLGILLWQIVGRGCNIIIVMLSEELWSNNIINLFSLPLKLSEWMLGCILFYAIIMGMVSIFSIFVIFALYKVALLPMILTFLMFLPPLFLCGIWLGFVCLQIIVMLGKRSVELGLVVGWGLLPFSGAYYPIEILPKWGQTISTFIPMSYLFQGMRGYVMHQQNPTLYLIKGYILSILYAILAVVLFGYFFDRSKQKGLARLVD